MNQPVIGIKVDKKVDGLCVLCQKRYKMTFDYSLFVVGSGEFICASCASKHDKEIVELLCVFHNQGVETLTLLNLEPRDTFYFFGDPTVKWMRILSENENWPNCVQFDGPQAGQAFHMNYKKRVVKETTCYITVKKEEGRVE